MHRPLFIPASFSLLVILSLCGCDSTKTSTPTAPPVQSLSIAYPRETGCQGAWEAVLNEWSARTGIKQTGTETDLPGDPSQPLPADLNIVPLTSVPELVYRKFTKPIPAEVLDERALDWQGLFQGLREKVCTLAGARMIVPLSCPTLVLYYRADLLAHAKRSPPETWDDYLKLTKELSDWAPGLSAVEPWQGDWAATMFLARAAAFAKHPDHTAFLFDLDSGDSLIDTPGFQKAWDIHRQIFQALSPDVRSMTPAHCRREILEGRAALAIAMETPLVIKSTPEDLPASTEIKRAAGIQVGFTQLPGTTESYNPSLKSWEPPRDTPVHRATLTAFDGIAAVTSAKLSGEGSLLAWNMLQTLTLDDDAVLPPRIVSPVRETDLARSDLYTAPPLEPIEQGEYLATTGRALRNRQIALEMPVVGRGKFLTALAESIRKSLAQPELSGEEFTHGIAEQWREIQQSVGKLAVRDSYRISHGMIPIPSKEDAPK